jgi:hypothetical protein
MNRFGRITFVIVVGCAIAAALRLGAWLPNIAAVGALALYAGSRLPAWLAWIPPLGVMAFTDILLERWFGYPPFNKVVYACFLIDVILGLLLVRRVTAMRVGIGAFVGALQFFLITNFFVWFNASEVARIEYPRTLAGLMTCYTMALPFFGYTLLGNLLFGAAFFGADAVLARASMPALAEGEAR